MTDHASVMVYSNAQISPAFCLCSTFVSCLVAIYWERAVLLTSLLLYYTKRRHSVGMFCSFHVWVLGQDVEFSCIGSRVLVFHLLL